MRMLLVRLRNLVWRDRAERELDEELSFHIEMETRKNRALGMGPAEAGRQARVEFGASTGNIKEWCRDISSFVRLEQMMQDLRQSWRGLMKSPGFTLLAMLALGLGTGVNTALFTGYNAVALKPLPVADADRVVRFERWVESGSLGNFQYGFSYAEYRYCLEHGDQFASLVAASWAAPVVAGPAAPGAKPRIGQLVSANYFSELGIPLRMGRGFVAGEDRTPGANPVVVISDRFWQSGFSGDPAILGRVIELNGVAFTVIGVTRKEFTGTTVDLVVPDFWAPLSMEAELVPGQDWTNRAEQRKLQIFGRPADWGSRARAQAQADLLVRRFAATERERDRTTAVTLQRTSYLPNADDIRFRALMAGAMLMVGLVLLVACANVGNMLLARGISRKREISTRLALGAGRLRIVRQLLLESTLLAMAGGLTGLALSMWISKALRSALGRYATLIGGEFSAVNLAPDWRVAAYVFAIAGASAILFGLWPALQCVSMDTMAGLKSESAAAGRAHASKVRNFLVSAQVAGSVVLLALAGLFARGLMRSRAADPGFAARTVYAITAEFGDWSGDPAKASAERRRLMERLEQRPEVAAVTLGSPPLGGTWTPPMAVGRTLGRTLAGYASETYFEALGIQVLRGRVFTPQEARSGPHVAVVSESTARHFWPDEDALGKTFALDLDFRGHPEAFEVIGIVKDVRFANLTRRDPAHVYLSAGASEYGSFAFDKGSSVNILVRARKDPQGVLAAVQAAAEATDRNLLAGLRLLNLADVAAQTQGALSEIVVLLAAILGGLALLLAGVGIYGVIGFLVSQRTREIGVRMALGAGSAAVWKGVLAPGMRAVLVGIALGVTVAGGLSAVLHETLVFPGSMDFLYGVPFYDPVTFASLVCFVTGVAALASAVPARRAMRIDPAVALRYE